MHRVVLKEQDAVAKKYEKIADNLFVEMFKSIQLLAFTVLWFDFDFSKEELIEFNKSIGADNTKCLDDYDEFNKAIAEIKKYSDFDVEHRVKEFPYSARVKMSGGIPKDKKNRGLAMVNLVNYQSISAIESYMVLALSQLIKTKRWRKTEVEHFWANLKREAGLTYSRGMKDEFIVKHFEEQCELELK